MKNETEPDVLEKNERGRRKRGRKRENRRDSQQRQGERERSRIGMPIVWAREGICEMMAQIAEREREFNRWIR